MRAAVRARSEPEPAGSPYLVLGLAVLFVSVGSILVRWAQAPALSVAFYRIFLAALFLAPFAARPAARSWPSLRARERALLVASGLALGVHFATWIASLSYTSVAASVLLVNTAPLFTLGFTRVFLRETIAPVVVGATGIALAGAGLIAAGDWTGSASSLRGALLALAGAVTLSLYHVIGRGLRAALPLPAYVLAVWSIAAAALALIAAAAGAPFTGHPPRTLAAVVALAVVPTLAGHGLVNRSLRSLSAPTVGLFLLGEPLCAAAFAYLAFGETPGPLIVAGGALVLAALALVVARGSR
ncbi:MAG TPA: DMT family transporter [Vicinamibacteria bacterium]|nr:DMT family transporter [Vicinamibacteria bacterium]